MADSVHVKGLAELQKFLDALPAKIEKNIMRSALRQGAKVIMAEAKLHVPVGPPSARNVRKYGAYAGLLRDSLRISTGYRNGKITASVKAGGKTKRRGDAYYAHMVEYGTAAHDIRAKKGGFLSFLGIVTRFVRHPGTRAQPFMRPALDGRAQEAVVAVGEQVKRRLTKAGIDAQDVLVEGDE